MEYGYGAWNDAASWYGLVDVNEDIVGSEWRWASNAGLRRLVVWMDERRWWLHFHFVQQLSMPSTAPELKIIEMFLQFSYVLWKIRCHSPTICAGVYLIWNVARSIWQTWLLSWKLKSSYNIKATCLLKYMAAYNHGYHVVSLSTNKAYGSILYNFLHWKQMVETLVKANGIHPRILTDSDHIVEKFNLIGKRSISGSCLQI